MQVPTRAKNNVSALELTHHLGAHYRTAWLIKKELRQYLHVRAMQRAATLEDLVALGVPAARLKRLDLTHKRRDAGTLEVEGVHVDLYPSGVVNELWRSADDR